MFFLSLFAFRSVFESLFSKIFKLHRVRPAFLAAHCCVSFLHVCSSAAGYTITSAPEDITVCHQVMNMTVISSAPSAVLSETICCSWQTQINSFPRYFLFLESRAAGSPAAGPAERQASTEEGWREARGWERRKEKRKRGGERKTKERRREPK